jgi:hypothetical protein
MKKKFLTIFAAISIIFLMNFSAGATTYVYMDYDGDPSFPRLTFQYDVGPLATFTGSEFRAGGFTAPDRSTVLSNISSFLYQDFSPYNIEFVTDTTGLLSYKTIGVDDKAYVFTNGPPYPIIDPSLPCPPGYTCYRLYGKTANSPGDLANDGTPIYYPDYSRIFGGSFTLPAGSASPSQPSLYGDTLDHISQALANIMAHELAHFWGVGHPSSYPGPGNLMWGEVEGIESTTNKSFSAGDQAILMSALGPRQEIGTAPEPTTILLIGSGLIGLWGFRKKFKK